MQLRSVIHTALLEKNGATRYGLDQVFVPLLREHHPGSIANAGDIDKIRSIRSALFFSLGLPKLQLIFPNEPGEADDPPI
jgi:hypothetical protein